MSEEFASSLPGLDTIDCLAVSPLGVCCRGGAADWERCVAVYDRAKAARTSGSERLRCPETLTRRTDFLCGHRARGNDQPAAGGARECAESAVVQDYVP